jgi:acetate kinase
MTEIEQLLNRESGLIGLCGSNDMRAILQAEKQGDPRAKLATGIFVYRVRKYIGAY